MEALQIITEEHQRLWRIVTTLDLVADDIDHGARIEQPFFDSAFDYLEQFMDGAHHAKEDGYLFPALRRRSADAAVILDRLQAEHRNGPENLKSLRAKLAAAASDTTNTAAFTEALRNYTASLKAHVRTEERDAMPLAREALAVEDWVAIDRAFLDNEDPVFGARARDEYRDLYHRIAAMAPESVGLGAHSAGTLKTQAEVAPAIGPVLLKVSGLESCYGKVKALKGLDLEVRQGETVALVGANGAGKTTFLRTLSGVQPMSAGRIVFNGEDISRMRADRRMRHGICQSPEGRQVFGPLAIEDNLRLGAYTRPAQEVEVELEKVYAMFPILKEKRKLPAGTLSGGQQQMLAIGRALMGRPKLLLLDEPSMGLAPLLVEEVFAVVRALKQQGMTIFLVEQNAFAALAIADRGYVLETGSITLTGTGQELINNEQVRAAYLGM